ncbi:hypothetical protein [Dapis sp. BLCC M172]|uniref:hypothetical protein n=1 Tax=Dapis sp. BLCC M172 TaxID=2975281 RepID=UPI003CE8C377
MAKKPLAHGFEMTCTADNLPSWAVRIEKAFCDCFLERHWLRKAEDITQKQLEMIEARYSYIKEGIYLQSFRMFKAYQGRGFKTFRQYCEQGIKKPYIWAKNTIKAAQISWGLLMQGFTELPDNVSQAVRFAESNKKVEEQKPDMGENWKEVLNAARKQKKPLTANFIERNIVGEISESMATAKLPRDVWEKLAEKAHKKGKSTQKLLKEIVENYLSDKNLGSELPETEPTNEDEITEVDEEKLEYWVQDVQDLVNESNKELGNNYDTTSNGSTIPEVFRRPGDFSPGD